MLQSGEQVAALVAPSFPAEFTEIADYRQFVGMLRALGFSHVFEVAFGADLVANRYNCCLRIGQVMDIYRAIVLPLKHTFVTIIPNWSIA
jgi:hypothetical protein